MLLKDFKSCIIKNKLPKDLVVLVCSDNHFLANQYINAIIKNNESKINKINSLFELTSSVNNLIIDELPVINILHTELFNEYLTDYSSIKNTIIICDSYDKALKDLLAAYTIVLPKFEEWQIKDYMKTICTGLDESDINWLYSVTRGDIFKLDNELSKICLFGQTEQTNILTELHYEQNTDLYNQSLFTICNAIIAKNKPFIADYILHKNCFKIDPFALVGLLLRNFKYLLFIKYGNGLTTDCLELPDRQIYAIKTSTCNFSAQQILKAINLLSSIDKQVKSGQLELKDDSLNLYIICRLFSL